MKLTLLIIGIAISPLFLVGYWYLVTEFIIYLTDATVFNAGSFSMLFTLALIFGLVSVIVRILDVD